MRKNPERLAWVVLLTSFALFILTATLVPILVQRFVDDHTSTRPARLDIIQGTVLVQRVGAPGEQTAKDAITLETGDTVRTAGDARAIIWLFDESNVELGPDSAVTLNESLSSTFSDRLSVLRLFLSAGKPVVNVALPGTRAREFTVNTSVGALALDEGSYDLDLTRPSAGEAIVRVGKATVSSASAQVVCRTGERAEMSAGSPPKGPLSLERNLVQNGDFTAPATPQAPLGAGWKADERASEGNIGTAEVVAAPGGNYLRFRRDGKGHGENYAVQVLEMDVSHYRTLKLRLEGRLVLQTLSGGGVAGSEYPLHVRIHYRNAASREGTFEATFYYQNTLGMPTTSAAGVAGQQRPQDAWFTIEADLMKLEPRLTSIIDLEIAASGWDYESHVRNVAIMAE